MEAGYDFKWKTPPKVFASSIRALEPDEGRRLAPDESCSGELPDCGELIRIGVAGRGRGDLFLDVRLTVAPTGESDDAGLFLCATKSGIAPQPGGENLHWVSEVATGPGVVGWRCRIQTQFWVYESSEFIALLRFDRQVPDVPPEHRCIYTGVDFTPLHGPPPSPGPSPPSFEASVSFSPEVLLLPSMELRAAHSTFYELYGGIDGHELSVTGKEDLGRDCDIELTYGEVEFYPFWRALERAVQPRPGEVFVDLGSGSGRAVAAAALGFPELRRCVGYEVVPPLSEAAERVAERIAQRSECRSAAIECRGSDFREESWAEDADIVWVSSLCMSQETLQSISEKSVKLRPGARLVTMDECFGVGLEESFEKVVVDGRIRFEVEMSFGEAGVYILRRM